MSHHKRARCSLPSVLQSLVHTEATADGDISLHRSAELDRSTIKELVEQWGEDVCVRAGKKGLVIHTNTSMTESERGWQETKMASTNDEVVSESLARLVAPVDRDVWHKVLVRMTKCLDATKSVPEVRQTPGGRVASCVVERVFLSQLADLSREKSVAGYLIYFASDGRGVCVTVTVRV